MKRREGLFRRPNKQASLVLEWIEECMEREPMWIHVQSSSEALPVAPTPPVTPTSLFGDAVADVAPGFRSDLNAIFSPCSSFMEIVTPTSEDHVLECALLFKKLRGHAEVVLLSSSTTLKIKAMAEVWTSIPVIKFLKLNFLKDNSTTSLVQVSDKHLFFVVIFTSLIFFFLISIGVALWGGKGIQG